MSTIATPSIKRVLSAQYFLYFGIFGIYLPYFNLYCYQLDFTGFQIGILSALKTLSTALFPLVWGALADHFHARRPIYILSLFTGTALWSFYLLTAEFWPMLIITIFYGFFNAPVISFLESFSMDLLGDEKSHYGRLRVWGTLSFVLVVIATGRLINVYPIRIILVMILAGSILQSLLSFSIPRIDRPHTSPFSPGARSMLNRRVLVFLFCAFLMLVSHGAYYGFFSIHLAKLGFQSTFIGFAWALASIAEIAVMIGSARIFSRYSYENVLVLAFLAATVRWLILAVAESAGLILLTQLFHAFSYGAFHIASILYIDKLTPPEAKTLGQAANNAVTYGMGMMVGFLVSGYLFEQIGAPRMFLMSSGLALVGGVLMFFERPEGGWMDERGLKKMDQQ